MRLTRDEITALKLEYNVEDKPQNGYSELGAEIHNLIEQFYVNSITRCEMAQQFNEKFEDFQLTCGKFLCASDTLNATTEKDYHENINLYIDNFIPINSRFESEKLFHILINGHLIYGYIDFVSYEDGLTVITDFKGSTVYTGGKIKQEQGQLLLYAYALHQNGVPLDKIKIRWDFLKYISAKWMLPNGQMITKTCKRNKLYELFTTKKSNPLIEWGNELGYSEIDIQSLQLDMMESNDINSLPSDLRDKITLDNCYIYITLTDDIINEFESEITNTIKQIETLTDMYEMTKDETYFMQEITNKDSFYMQNLCGYSAKLHKPYATFIEHNKFFWKKFYYSK